jgi:hypothetical protein
MPKTRIVEKTVYTFDELSDRAKDVARDWYRDDPDLFSFAAESVLEYTAEAAERIGIHIHSKSIPLANGKTRHEPVIYWQGFSYQGDGASYAADYRYVAGGAKAIADEFPEGDDKGFENNNRLNRIARTLEIIQRTHGNSIAATVHIGGRSTLGRSMNIDVERTDDIPDPLHNPLPAATEQAVTELLRDFADWIFACLRDEHDYINSNEVVDESILANEYEFDVDGNRT